MEARERHPFTLSTGEAKQQRESCASRIMKDLSQYDNTLITQKLTLHVSLSLRTFGFLKRAVKVIRPP